MSGKKIKKIPSLVWPGKIKTWWSFLLILSLFGSKKESLREWSRPGTLPSGPLRCFPSSDILTTVTKFWVAQKKDFLNIWGGPALGGSRRAEKSRKVLMMMMKAAKLGWAGPGAGQEQGRNRAGAELRIVKQSREERGQELGRNWGEARGSAIGQYKAVILSSLKYS